MVTVLLHESRRATLLSLVVAHPENQLLIRQHAHRAVSEFVDQGMPRAMRPTPLPQSYSPP
jgi:hypothetical protein